MDPTHRDAELSAVCFFKVSPVGEMYILPDETTELKVIKLRQEVRVYTAVTYVDKRLH